MAGEEGRAGQAMPRVQRLIDRCGFIAGVCGIRFCKKKIRVDLRNMNPSKINYLVGMNVLGRKLGSLPSLKSHQNNPIRSL